MGVAVRGSRLLFGEGRARLEAESPTVAVGVRQRLGIVSRSAFSRSAVVQSWFSVPMVVSFARVELQRADDCDRRCHNRIDLGLWLLQARTLAEAGGSRAWDLDG